MLKKEKNTMNKKGMIGVIVGIIVFFISYYGVQYLFFKPVLFDKQLIEVANETNKMCPMRVDQYLMLDNVMALPNKGFQYNYTMIDIEKSQIDLEIFKEEMEPKIINNVKTHPDLKIYRDNKVTMHYNYQDKNRVFLMKIVVTPDLYAE